jgi:carboxypeptidase family protein
VVGAGIFAWPFQLNDSDCTSSLPLVVKAQKGGTITALLKSSKGGLGTRAEVSGRVCQSTEPGRMFRLPVPVGRDGRIETAVPAACLDINLATNGFTPAMRLGVQVTSDAPTDLGEIRLQPGAVLEVAVAAAWSHLPLAGVTLGLVPEVSWGDVAARALAGENVRMWKSKPSNQEGHIRLDSLQTGRYGGILVSEDPSIAHVAIPPFTLASGAPLNLGVIEMPASAELRVVIGAPFAKQMKKLPGEWEWRLLLAQTADCDGRPTGQPARAVLLTDDLTLALTPGSWGAELDLVGEDGRLLTLHREQIDLAPGDFRTLQFEESSTLFMGELRWKGDPIKGELRFSRQDGSSGPLPWATADQDGVFATVLPKAGIYDVAASWKNSRGSQTASLRGVEFSDPSTPVRLDLPEAEITGSVVDEDGKPVVKALVEAIWQPANGSLGTVAPPSTALTSSDGRYLLEALSAGTWALRARAESLVSPVTFLPLSGTRSSQDVTLVVSRTRHLEGQLSRLGSPLVGRGVIVHLPDTGSPMVDATPFQTDASGSFSVELPTGLKPRALLMLSPPGQVVGARWIDLSDEKIDVRFDLPTGSLQFDPGAVGWSDDLNPLQLALVNSNGATVLAIAVGQAAGAPAPGTTTPLRLDNIEVGEWRIVEMRRSQAELMAVVSGVTSALPLVGTTQVRPGSTSTFTVREAKEP